MEVQLVTQDHSPVRNTEVKPRSASETLFLTKLEFHLFQVLICFIDTARNWHSRFLLMWLFWTFTFWNCPTGYCNNLWPGVILFDVQKDVLITSYFQGALKALEPRTQSLQVKGSWDRHWSLTWVAWKPQPESYNMLKMTSLKKPPHSHAPHMYQLTTWEETLPNSLSQSKWQSGHSNSQQHYMKWTNVQILRKEWNKEFLR